jgi:long-subunit fatty acid transport protein
MMDARTDEVDRRAKNNLDFTLRSRIQAVYSIPKTPLGVVGKLEMLSTLNAPVDYINDLVSSSDRYGDYISEWRPELGVQWKINKQNTLSLSYRYNYLYSRNIEVLESGDATITNKYTNKHLILLTYKFGW